MSTINAAGQAWIETQKAIRDEWIAYARRAARLPRVIAQARRVKKGATPSEVVYEEDRLKLLHYPGNGQFKHQDAAVVRLRPGQSSIHPGHFAK